MVLLPILLACDPDPVAAPPTLDDALFTVLREFTTLSPEQADVLVGLVEKGVFPEEAGVRLGAISAADVQGVDFQGDVDWSQVYGGALARNLSGNLQDYAASVPLPDQAAVVGEGYARWERTLVDGDARSYAQGEPLAAEDAVEKQAPLGIVLPYPQRKEWRTIPSDGGDYQLMRSVIHEEGWSEDGRSAVVVGFTVELWLPREGGLAWFNGTWTQVVTPLGDLATPEFLVGQILQGAESAMLGTEAWAIAP